MDKLLQLLQEPDRDTDTKLPHKTLEKIVNSWKLCQKFVACPPHFKFVLRDNAQFNSTVYFDLIWIDKKPVLQAVDQATRYQAAHLVPSIRYKKVWEALRLCWINVYIGQPHVIAPDAGKNFLAESFQQNADLL